MCPIVRHLVERRVPSLAVAAKKSAIHRFPCHAQRAFALWAAPGRACQEREPPRTTAGACLSSSSPPRRHEAITRHAEPRSVRVSWSRPTGWPSAGRHGDRAAVGSHRRDRQEAATARPAYHTEKSSVTGKYVRTRNASTMTAKARNPTRGAHPDTSGSGSDRPVLQTIDIAGVAACAI